MPEPADWSTATFEGNRRRQHQEFYALSLREKIKRIEEMAEVTARLRAAPATPPSARQQAQAGTTGPKSPGERQQP
jgi:hypothetical protein